MSKAGDSIESVEFSVSEFCGGEDTLFTALTEEGRITVLDRMTGWGDGIRDIETGFSDKDGTFWLASGGCDVRTQRGLTVGEAIEWIKKNANTCVAVPRRSK